MSDRSDTDSRPISNCKYSAAEERLHDPGDVPRYSESAYFNFACGPGSFVLGGVLRVGLRPNDGYREFFALLPLADGTTLYWSGREPAARADFVPGSGSWRTASLALDVVKPGTEWRIRYADLLTRRILHPASLGSLGQALKASDPIECELDLTFTASHPLHVMQESGDMIPGEEAAKDHYEQFGRVAGALRIGGESREIAAAPAFRDHSWGPRNYVSAMSNMDWFTIQLDDGDNFVGFRIRSRPDLPPQGALVNDTGATYLGDVRVTTDWNGDGALRSPLAIDATVAGQRICMTAEIERAVMMKHRSEHGVAHNTIGLMRVNARRPTRPGLDGSEPARARRGNSGQWRCGILRYSHEH